jgi:hypothetical protein
MDNADFCVFLFFKFKQASDTPHPRLVVTASSVHDPATPGGDVGSKYVC